MALALCLISGTPPGDFSPAGALPAPSSLAGPQGSASPVGCAQTGQRIHPRTAGDVPARHPGDAGGWAIWLWVPHSELQQGPHSCKQGPLPGVGQRTGPPGAAGEAACGTVHSSALPCPPGVKACGGLPGVLPAADGRLRGPVPLRESPDAPGPRLPGPALLPSLCCSSISPILKA